MALLDLVTSQASDTVHGAAMTQPYPSSHSLPYHCLFCSLHRGVGGHQRGIVGDRHH